MADKNIKLNYTETGITAYCIIKQESSGNVYDENDGAFRSYATATDPHVELTEHTNIKGLYEKAISDTFSDGRYTISCYKQSGGSPAPASDTVIGSGDLFILNNAEVTFKSIADRVEENAFQNSAVWIDTVNGSAGTAYPLGTALNPSGNFSDALTIAVANGIGTFIVSGSIIIGASDDISNYVFLEGSSHATITFTAGCTTLNSVFKGHIHLQGTLSGHAHFRENHFLNGTYGIEGFCEECLFDDGNYSVGNGLTRFIDSHSSGQQGQSVTLSTAGASVDLGIWGWSGKMEIEDKNGIETFDIEMLTGELEIASSCTAGSIRVRGVAEVTDNSGVGCTVNTGKLITQQIDDYLSSIHGSGVWDIATVITNLTEIKGSGWVDENLTTINTVINSLDTQIKRVLGLLHENVKYTSPSYDTDGNLTQVTITIYDDNTLTNEIASYTWTSTGNGAGKFSVAQQVKN